MPCRLSTTAAPAQRLAEARRYGAKVLASPLFDAPRFARHLETALHGMWEEQRRQRSAGRDA